MLFNDFYRLTPIGFEYGTKSVSVGKNCFCAINYQYYISCYSLRNIGEFPFKPIDMSEFLGDKSGLNIDIDTKSKLD